MTALQILAILVCGTPVALLLSIWFLALRELADQRDVKP